MQHGRSRGIKSQENHAISGGKQWTKQGCQRLEFNGCWSPSGHERMKGDQLAKVNTEGLPRRVNILSRLHPLVIQPCLDKLLKSAPGLSLHPGVLHSNFSLIFSLQFFSSEARFLWALPIYKSDHMYIIQLISRINPIYFKQPWYRTNLSNEKQNRLKSNNWHDNK